jgi:hypothetical protein
MTDWFWAYLTRERSARLITGDAEELHGVLHVHEPGEVRPAARATSI